jgi:HEPN domain-containing protein
MEKEILYWIEHAEYDLVTAEAMFESGRYLYVTFMCQQAIEKLLKAMIIKFKSLAPPYSHNLRRLAEIAGIDDQMADDQINFLDDLTPFCVAARYPAYKVKMAKIATREFSSYYLKQTKEMFQWLSNLMK